MERKMKLSRPAKIWMILSIAWMVAIFLFSAESGDDSQELSWSVGGIIGQIFVPGFAGWSAAKQMAFVQMIDHAVRKCAHATEYAVLGILYLGTLRRLPEREGSAMRHPALTALVMAFLYACTDEIHQIFVPDRGPGVKDVMIDTAGALAGIVIYLLVSRIAGAVRKKKQN
ncbi:MAG: VanZ family protein [Eubacteriales bacterium]|jgi:VanZ family protein